MKIKKSLLTTILVSTLIFSSTPVMTQMLFLFCGIVCKELGLDLLSRSDRTLH